MSAPLCVFFSTIDDAMQLLAQKLELVVRPLALSRPWSQPLLLTGLPYGPDGNKLAGGSLTLDFRPGSKLFVVNQPAWDRENVGNVCEVVEASEELASEGHIKLRFGGMEQDSIFRVLGRWWLDAMVEGTVKTLPVAPCSSER